MRIAFVFPMASGHINPSLPVARALTALGHEIHYLCFELLRDAIESTGALFHDVAEQEVELYAGREATDYAGVETALKMEHGIANENYLGFLKLRNVMLELQLPGLLRFLRDIAPQAIVFDPLRSREAAVAAQLLHIPSIALLTTAGPGSYANILETLMRSEGVAPESLDEAVRSFRANAKAVKRLNCQYGLSLEEGYCKAFGWMDALSMASTTLVTTCQEMQDPMPRALARAYKDDGAVFNFVGPLIDETGAKRAGCGSGSHDTHVLEKVQQAISVDRPVVLVSMGTILTGTHPHLGWDAKKIGIDGRSHGLRGRELAQAAWAGAFDALGTCAENEGALLVVSTGSRADALDNVTVPPNAVCAVSLPQVDILKLGVSAFVTHVGQNSFMESLLHGTPVVACPGFGDQFANAAKAVDLGVGLKVDRPDPDDGQEEVAKLQYRDAVCEALLRLWSDPSFSASASRVAGQLRRAGGVQSAVNTILQVASSAWKLPACGGA